MNKNEVIILVHGFNKTGSDMSTLQKYLSQKGYRCLTATLPTRFGTVEECSRVLLSEFKSLLEKPEYHRIHFVGHSMGGLIIKNILEKFHIPKLGRCVFISTPAKGTYLADLAYNFFPAVLKGFKSLNDLRTNNLPKAPENCITYPEIGVIAGNKCNLILGKLLKKDNDGRVEVDSTKIDIMKDFTVLPYGHKEIHHQAEIAELVQNFLHFGRFDLEYPSPKKEERQ